MKQLSVFLVVFLISGCTGTQIKVTPEPPVRSSNAMSLPSVGIEDRTIGVHPAAGDIADAFAKELRNSRLAQDVYYPQRPKDPIDTTLETKFNLNVDQHAGSAMAKAFFTGFTLFLLEPAFWYDHDYTLIGDVDVIKNG